MATPRIGLLTLLIVMTTGCASVNYPVPPLPSREEAPAYYKPALEKDYRLQDTWAIRSFLESQLNHEMAVRPDGRISVLLIGDLSAAGMRPENLALQIRESYRRMVGSTDETVAVTRSAGMNIYLSGEAKSPSLLQLDGDLTLLLHNTDDGTLTVNKVDIEKILRNEAPDVLLQRRDVVHAPKNGIPEAGEFVEQYINAIVPRFIQFQFGWLNTSVTDRNAVQVQSGQL